jgi:hypothetical protein
MPRSLRVLLPVSVFLFTVGCYETAVGPQGPRGPRGPSGDPAVRSFVVEFDASAAAVNGLFVSATYDAPEISPRVVESGMVTAYVREQGTWTAMPYTYGVESPDLPAVDFTVTLGYAYEVDFVEVFFEVSTPAAIETLGDRTVKFVVLDGSPASYATVNWADYASVAARFGLEE